MNTYKILSLKIVDNSVYDNTSIQLETFGFEKLLDKVWLYTGNKPTLELMRKVNDIENISDYVICEVNNDHHKDMIYTSFPGKYSIDKIASIYKDIK